MSGNGARNRDFLYVRTGRHTTKEDNIMWARVAAFEGGDQEKLLKLNDERMTSGDMSPPDGMKRVLLLADADKNRRLFIAFFDSQDSMAAAEQGFEQMGNEIPEDVRGSRTAVDYYEIVTDESV
jgi:DNA-binding LacI/PurR family transcriptional regulator